MQYKSGKNLDLCEAGRDKAKKLLALVWNHLYDMELHDCAEFIEQQMDEVETSVFETWGESYETLRNFCKEVPLELQVDTLEHQFNLPSFGEIRWAAPMGFTAHMALWIAAIFLHHFKGVPEESFKLKFGQFMTHGISENLIEAPSALLKEISHV